MGGDDILWWSAAEWQAVGTIVLVLVTIWYAFRTHQMSKHARSSAASAERSAEAAERSAATSQAAVEAAERSAVASETSTRLAIMPLVVVDPTGRVDELQRAVYRFVIANYGVGVALNVSTEIEFRMPRHAGALPETRTTTGIGVLPPGQTRNRSAAMHKVDPPWEPSAATTEYQDAFGRRYRVFFTFARSGREAKVYRLDDAIGTWEQLV